MKNHLFIAFIAVVVFSCNLSTSGKKAVDDSLQYYPPTPSALSREEFRYYFRSISSFLDTALNQDKGFNGGILIAKNGSVIYEKYQGLIDLRKNDSINAATAFHIASTSKTFTSIAILHLIEQNKLSLTDTITRFFPELPYPNVTVKMLLCHRSGLPNYLHFMSNLKWGTDKKGKWNKQYARNEDVLKVMKEKKPARAFKPDEKFTYCNTNFLLLALIIEKLTGKLYPEYMQQQYFLPLQMNNTFVFTLKDTVLATPSFTSSGTYWGNDFLDATYGDKNIYSTPQDLLKWDQALYTNQLLSPSLLDSAFTPQSVKDTSVHNYGLGWRLQILPNSKKVVYHFGKWHGFNAAFARLTDEKATIIILGNRFTERIYSTASLCYDIFGDYRQKMLLEAEESETIKPAEIVQTPKKKLKKTRR